MLLCAPDRNTTLTEKTNKEKKEWQMLFSSFHSYGQGLTHRMDKSSQMTHAYVGAFVFLWPQWIINSCCDMCVLSERVLLEWQTFFLFFFSLFAVFSRWYAFRRFGVSHLHLLSFDNKTNRISLRLQLTFDLSCQLPPGDVVRDSWVQ